MTLYTGVKIPIDMASKIVRTSVRNTPIKNPIKGFKTPSTKLPNPINQVSQYPPRTDVKLPTKPHRPSVKNRSNNRRNHVEQASNPHWTGVKNRPITGQPHYFTYRRMRWPLAAMPQEAQVWVTEPHCTCPLHRSTCGQCQYFPSYTRGPPWRGLFGVATCTFAWPPRTLAEKR